ncbi:MULTISPECIES: SOS response-associated peptidase family protein [unclassified Caballeronia]|nr:MULTISPECIES: SOS response-associated peptidase family protein [unclassified Caballeronia]MDR5777133.1 SOS response-associated peptidase family protein [Caballeronia sp. LZ002]MDR5852534.1 SOS response-associated peptidase family protein [Caballeronia sp. LZ003]
MTEVAGQTRTAAPKDRFDVFSLFPVPNFDYKPEIYKDYAAPIFRRIDRDNSTDAASFGIVPRRFIPQGVKAFDTMNARAESVGQKTSFRSAWNKLQLALIPCRRFYEPNYETGKAVRWRIGMADESPLAIAGLWRAWKDPAEERHEDRRSVIECRMKRVGWGVAAVPKPEVVADDEKLDCPHRCEGAEANTDYRDTSEKAADARKKASLSESPSGTILSK